MKKLFSLTFFSLMLFNGFSQISVEEDMERDSIVWTPFNGSISDELSIPKLKCYYGGENGTYYVYFYQNPKYTQITDIHSIYLGDKKQTLDFFNLLMGMKGTGKEYDLKISSHQLHIKEDVFVFKRKHNVYISIYDKKDKVQTHFEYEWVKKILEVLK